VGGAADKSAASSDDELGRVRTAGNASAAFALGEERLGG